jgi:hypothetical protein
MGAPPQSGGACSWDYDGAETYSIIPSALSAAVALS